MFDPHDYFDIRHNRAVCPVHGKRDRNLEIRRHKSGDKWTLNCYSHNCSLSDIALAAGFNPKDIYDKDTHEGYIDLTQYISTTKTPIHGMSIEQKVEDTFGAHTRRRNHNRPAMQRQTLHPLRATQKDDHTTTDREDRGERICRTYRNNRTASRC